MATEKLYKYTSSTIWVVLVSYSRTFVTCENELTPLRERVTFVGGCFTTHTMAKICYHSFMNNLKEGGPDEKRDIRVTIESKNLNSWPFTLPAPKEVVDQLLTTNTMED